MSVVEIPKRAMVLPLILTEISDGVTLTDSIANQWSEILRYQCRKKTAIAVSPRDRLYLYLATSVPAQITAGTVRMFVTDPSRVYVRHLVLEADISELDAGGTREDREKQFFFPMGFTITEDQWLVIEFKGASVAATAQTKMSLTGKQVVQVG